MVAELIRDEPGPSEWIGRERSSFQDSKQGKKVSLPTQKIAAQATGWVYYLVCRLNRDSCHIIASHV